MDDHTSIFFRLHEGLPRQAPGSEATTRWLHELAARAFWADGYPAMTDVAAAGRLAEEAGYDVVATYRLPNRDWWQEYYTPLTARLDALESTDDEVLAAVVAEERREIDLHRDHGDEYGYTGFVLRCTDPGTDPAILDR